MNGKPARQSISCAVFTCLLLIASWNSSSGVLADKIPQLNFNCLPCVAYGGFYCMDDPWKINFNGDLCYENAVDRPACGEGFNFTNDVRDCYGQIINTAKACPNAEEIFSLYNQPFSFEIKLEPRTSCQISIQAYSSEVRTVHQYPIILYHQ